MKVPPKEQRIWDPGITVLGNILYTIDGILKSWGHILGTDVTKMPIRFRFNTAKALEALLWLLQRHPGLTRHTIAKVLFYADKRHLEEFGRPVIGDTYVAMDEGMVPSRVLDMLERDGRHLRDDEIEAIDSSIEAYKNEEGYWAYRALRDPRTEYLSRTDIDALDSSLSEYGDLDFEELRRIAHQEPAWGRVYEPGGAEEMDYQDIIDADHPKRDLLLRKLRETSRRKAL